MRFDVANRGVTVSLVLHLYSESKALSDQMENKNEMESCRRKLCGQIDGERI